MSAMRLQNSAKRTRRPARNRRLWSRYAGVHPDLFGNRAIGKAYIHGRIKNAIGITPTRPRVELDELPPDQPGVAVIWDDCGGPAALDPVSVDRVLSVARAACFTCDGLVDVPSAHRAIELAKHFSKLIVIIETTTEHFSVWVELWRGHKPGAPVVKEGGT